MAPSNPLIISSSMICLLPGLYHFQTLFGVDKYIFIVVGQSKCFPVPCGILHSKVISYQFRYSVQDEVGSYTIVLYFHTAMANNKKQ